MLAAVLMETAVLLSIVADRPVTEYFPLAAPIGLQEMVVAVWLLVKGFRSTADVAPEAGRAQTR